MADSAVRWIRLLGTLLILAIAGAACGSSSAELPAGVSVAAGHQLTIVTTGFDRPTQLAFTPAGDLILGALTGGENEASGSVILALAPDFEDRTILQSGLDKPTGVAVIGTDLWIMQRDSLAVTTLGPDAELTIVAADLPNNGRSEGTLTVAPDGALLFDTAGRKRGAVRTEGSGTVFELPEPSAWQSMPPESIATGFKHAYAHTFTADGKLWAVEMTDGNFDGERASDELVQVSRGDDGGWPFCVDDNRVVAEFGGTPEICAESPSSHALFGPGSTPTSIVVAPWDPELLLVTLWITGTVVAVPTDPAGAPYVGQVIIDGIESPQSLLVDGDRVLVADHETGTVFALTATD